jgi:large subunit ribosomal protein L24e
VSKRASATLPMLKRCSFCGRPIPVATGLMIVKNDGHIFWTCSSKCRKHMFKLRRDPRKLKWTEKYAKGGIRVKKK